MASDIWLRTILIVRKETRCRHIGYSYRLTARVLLYAPSHRQDKAYQAYHALCYTSRGALAGTRNSSMGPPLEGSIRRPIAPWVNAPPLSNVPLLPIVWLYPVFGDGVYKRSLAVIEEWSVRSWCDGLSDQSFMVVHHDWCNRPWYVLSSLWDGAYKRTLTVNQKEYPMWRQRVSFLTIRMVLNHMPDAI